MPTRPGIHRPHKHTAAITAAPAYNGIERHKERLGSTARGYTYKWQQASKRYLATHPLCVECERQNIIEQATEVDHITPHRGDMQLFWDPENWQGLCHLCHSRKTAREDAGFRGATMLPNFLQQPDKPLTLVCGPPAAGKTTYVHEQAGDDDLVLDMDDLALDIFGAELHTLSADERYGVIRMRNTLLADFCKGITRHPRCWLIATAGSLKHRNHWAALGAQVIVINPGIDTCLMRIERETRRPTEVRAALVKAVHRWA